MADFEEKLNAILGDQQAMGQIMALARSLSGGEKGETTPPTQTEPLSPPAIPQPATPPDLSTLMGQLDPAMLRMVTGLFQEFRGQDDRSVALLTALRPFLRADRQARLDRAVEIARMTRLIRAARDTMGRKEGGDV